VEIGQVADQHFVAPRPAGPEAGIIYCDDNLHRLSLMPRESIDLIYLDPPFFSNKYYEVIWGDEAEVRSFEDRWEGGINHYIGWMHDRVLEMDRVLASTGSIYLHCDPAASHHLKVMMDSIFGAQNFRNEIIWKRTSAHNTAKRYGPVHDTILFYSKGTGSTWNPQLQSYSEEYLRSHYNNTDLDGRRYRLNDITGPGVRHGESGQPWRSFDPTENGRHWTRPPAELDEMDAKGLIHWPKSDGWPAVKRYLEGGVPLQDVWTDVAPINSQAKERLGYPTQKPEALLDRIVRASSNENDVVLDPFCGCGTTVVVAERLKRRWIGIDISPTACNMMYRRLVKIRAAEIKLVGMPTTQTDLLKLKPFEFQNWIIDRINGIQSSRKSGDMGIDGWTFLLKEPVQVKQSEKVGRNVVDNFETAIKRAHHCRGYIIAFSFGRGAREEVARVRQDGLDIRLLPVRDLLERPDWVMVQMGIAGGLPQLSVAPMPQITPSRRSAEELIESDVGS
jgi:DNA modification methylase